MNTFRTIESIGSDYVVHQGDGFAGQSIGYGGYDAFAEPDEDGIEGIGGKLKKARKKIGRGLEKVGKKALPIAAVAANFVPGVGQVASVALGAAAQAVKARQQAKRAARAAEAEQIAVAEAQAAEDSSPLMDFQTQVLPGESGGMLDKAIVWSGKGKGQVTSDGSTGGFGTLGEDVPNPAPVSEGGSVGINKKYLLYGAAALMAFFMMRRK